MALRLCRGHCNKRARRKQMRKITRCADYLCTCIIPQITRIYKHFAQFKNERFLNFCICARAALPKKSENTGNLHKTKLIVPHKTPKLPKTACNVCTIRSMMNTETSGNVSSNVTDILSVLSNCAQFHANSVCFGLCTLCG